MQTNKQISDERREWNRILKTLIILNEWCLQHLDDDLSDVEHSQSVLVDELLDTYMSSTELYNDPYCEEVTMKWVKLGFNWE
jgi:hypothetical protein